MCQKIFGAKNYEQYQNMRECLKIWEKQYIQENREGVINARQNLKNEGRNKGNAVWRID